jgi:hypothetical protein
VLIVLTCGPSDHSSVAFVTLIGLAACPANPIPDVLLDAALGKLFLPKFRSEPLLQLVPFQDCVRAILGEVVSPPNINAEVCVPPYPEFLVATV